VAGVAASGEDEEAGAHPGADRERRERDQRREYRQVEASREPEAQQQQVAVDRRCEDVPEAEEARRIDHPGGEGQRQEHQR
jgi:hypothetical protein